jgi:hypothetical protein
VQQSAWQPVVLVPTVLGHTHHLAYQSLLALPVALPPLPPLPLLLLPESQLLAACVAIS